MLPRAIVCAAAIGILGATEAASQSCVLDVEWFNRNRHVFGSVNTECGDCFFHTPPWGNWGVTSQHSEDAVNGTQFMGWKVGQAATPACIGRPHENITDNPEWNSCTDDARYSSPSAEYYNYSGDTEQFSADVRTYAAASIRRHELSCPFDQDGDGQPDTGGCSGLDRISMSELMVLYEQDPVTRDSEVARLSFPYIDRHYIVRRFGVRPRRVPLAGQSP